jgi:hypothetical protein
MFKSLNVTMFVENNLRIKFRHGGVELNVKERNLEEHKKARNENKNECLNERKFKVRRTKFC